MSQGTKLTPGQIAELLKAEYALSVVLGDYDKAERCGADCNEVRALVKQAIEQSQTIRKEFGPSNGMP